MTNRLLFIFFGFISWLALMSAACMDSGESQIHPEGKTWNIGPHETLHADSLITLEVFPPSLPPPFRGDWDYVLESDIELIPLKVVSEHNVFESSLNYITMAPESAPLEGVRYTIRSRRRNKSMNSAILSEIDTQNSGSWIGVPGPAPRAECRSLDATFSKHHLDIFAVNIEADCQNTWALMSQLLDQEGNLLYEHFHILGRSPLQTFLRVGSGIAPGDPLLLKLFPVGHQTGPALEKKDLVAPDPGFWVPVILRVGRWFRL